jgi:site-specific DNA-cytosine methylase
MGASYTPDEWDEWTARMRAEHGNGNGHGKSLHVEAARIAQNSQETPLLPTPRTSDTNGAGDHWGQYAAAIARWEAVLDREAPAPTEPTGKGGAHRLSPRFVEWMMGLPDGWVTDVPGVSRNDALKALGNGVVPQQAAVAVRHLLAVRASVTEVGA